MWSFTIGAFISLMKCTLTFFSHAQVKQRLVAVCKMNSCRYMWAVFLTTEVFFPVSTFHLSTLRLQCCYCGFHMQIGVRWSLVALELLGQSSPSSPRTWTNPRRPFLGKTLGQIQNFFPNISGAFTTINRSKFLSWSISKLPFTGCYHLLLLFCVLIDMLWFSYK